MSVSALMGVIIYLKKTQQNPCTDWSIAEFASDWSMAEFASH